jgi:hypothetical protein
MGGSTIGALGTDVGVRGAPFGGGAADTSLMNTLVSTA